MRIDKNLANSVLEGAAAAKINLITNQGVDIYDGDPAGYTWRPSRIKNGFDNLNTLLSKVGRKFDRLVIRRGPSKRYFLAVSNGAPEFSYYYEYDDQGYASFVFVDYLKLKTEEFYRLPPDQRLAYLTKPVELHAVDIWKKDRSVTSIGSYLTTLTSDQADAEIKSIRSKILTHVKGSDYKRAYQIKTFINYLLQINTKAAQHLAIEVSDTYKQTILNQLVDIAVTNLTGIKYICSDLTKSGFTWSFIDNFFHDQRTRIVDRVIEELRQGECYLFWNFLELKKLFPDWPDWKKLENDYALKKNYFVTYLHCRVPHSSIPMFLQFFRSLPADAQTDPAVKNTIITGILKAMKNNAFKAVANNLQEYKSVFPDWPEWGIIEKSLRAEKLINEDKRNEAQQLAIIDNNPQEILSITRPSERLQLAAIKKDWTVFKYIDNPTKKAVITTLLKAIRTEDLGKDGYYKSIERDMFFDIYGEYHDRYPNWPEWEAIDKSLRASKIINESNYSNLNSASEQKQLAAVRQRGWAIQYIENPSEAVQLAAVQEYGSAIQYITNPSAAVQLAAVKQDGRAILFIQNPSEAVQLAAVQEYGYAIQYITNPSAAVQLAAVQQEGSAIKYIKNPSEQAQLAAINYFDENIKYITNPSEASQLLAVTADYRNLLRIANPTKNTILKTILILIKNVDFERPQYKVTLDFFRYFNTFKNLHPDWQEWEAIDKSLRASKIINESRYSNLNSASEQKQLAAVRQSGFAIKYVKNPSKALQLAAVQRNGLAIEYIRNPSEAVQLAAVNENGLAIQYIKNPPEAVQLAAVQEYGSAIQYITNPSAAVQLAAVTENGYAIRHIKNPPEAVQLAAVKKVKNLVISRYNITSKDSALIELLTRIKSNELKNHMMLYYVLRHTFPEWEEWAAIDQSLRASKLINESSYSNLNSASEEEQIAAVQNFGLAIKHIKNPSEAVQLAAVQQNGLTLEYIKWPSKAVQLAAVRQRGWAIRHIENPSEAVQLAAVTENGYAIQYIKNPTEATQLAAVRQNGFAIEYIPNPSEAVQLTAIEQNWYAIQNIENPSEAVQLAAIRINFTAIDYIAAPTKTTILTAILTLLKMVCNSNMEKGLYHDFLKYYYNKYKIIYPDWPEWKMIEPGMREVGLIKESIISSDIRITQDQINLLNNVPEETLMQIVAAMPEMLQYIRNPSEAVQIAAVSSSGQLKNSAGRTPFAIEFIRNPSATVQLAAVKAHSHAFELLDQSSNPPTDKQVILTGLLKLLKEKMNDPYSNEWTDFLDLLNKYQKRYPKWQEWYPIYESLYLDKKLRPKEIVWQTWQNIKKIYQKPKKRTE